MNPYYQNWNYGYTLGAATESSRGAYTVYGGAGGAKNANTVYGGANHANLATPTTTTTQGKVSGWAQVKGTQPANPPKAQVFVTAAPAPAASAVKSEAIAPTTSIKSEPASSTPGPSSDWAQAPAIGPTKPQAVVSPSQVI